MKEQDETHAVEQVIERLTGRFSDLPHTEIQSVVHEEDHRLEGRPVRDYISVLVERAARTRLRAVEAKQRQSANAAH